MMSMFAKTTSSMARIRRSIVLSQGYVTSANDDDDDLSVWEIVDGSLGVRSFDSDDSMSDGDSGSIDLVLSGEDGDGGVSRVVSLVVPHELECGGGYGDEFAADEEEEGACESRELVSGVDDDLADVCDDDSGESVPVQVVLSNVVPVVEPVDKFAYGIEDVVDDGLEEEGACDSGEVVTDVDDGLADACDDSGESVPIQDLQVVSVAVPVVVHVDEFEYGHGYGYGIEEDVVDDDSEEDDLYGEEYDVDDYLMPWKLKDRFGKQRIKKIGKKCGSKMAKKKRTPYYCNRPGNKGAVVWG